jgi:hypothetical protein
LLFCKASYDNPPIYFIAEFGLKMQLDDTDYIEEINNISKQFDKQYKRVK